MFYQNNKRVLKDSCVENYSKDEVLSYSYFYVTNQKLTLVLNLEHLKECMIFRQNGKVSLDVRCVNNKYYITGFFSERADIINIGSIKHIMSSTEMYDVKKKH
ncbi:hypothetical protein [Wolbachia endosymbiont of Pentidionis agamae]|uniref:hypothetical protein n=1 Tax=Wolbachia endosymbiont of Pentidionis agamae TaxID=3110435 RepID=UPI002FCFF0F3